jgi:ABC-type transport system involved in multi-copper enzyme maturation permease subunit
MPDLLKFELYKLVHSPVCVASAALCVVLDVMLCVVQMATGSYQFSVPATVMVDISFIESSILVGSIWCEEYERKTFYDILIGAYSRGKIFIAKTAVTLLSTSLVCLVDLCLIGLFTAATGNLTNISVSSFALSTFAQWLLLMSITSLFVLAAVLCRNFSYLTILMIVLYLVFKWMDSRAQSIQSPGILDNISYLTVQYRAVDICSMFAPSMMMADYTLCILIPICLIAGCIVFCHQQF